MVNDGLESRRTWSTLISSRSDITSALLLLLLFALFASTYLVRPIVDPDVFWHLKSGEWLWQEKSWPIPDPFSFTSPPEFDARQLFIVKGYWLAQLIYYSFHSLFDWTGIIVLRFLLFMLLVGILWARRSGDQLVWAGLIFLYLVSVLSSFPIERPQFFTFILFAWFYLFLDKYFSGNQIVRPFHVILACALMLFWGNLHGGVLLGQLLIVLGAVCVGIRSLVGPAENRFSEDRNLLILLGACLVSSFCNPNALSLPAMFYQTASAADIMFSANEEFYSLTQLAQAGRFQRLFPYAVFLILGLWGLIAGWRAQSIFSAVLVVGTAIYAGMNVRYHPLFMLTVLPVAARGLEPPSIRRFAVGVLAAVAVFLGIFFTRVEVANLARVGEMGWVSSDDFPVDVADEFLERAVDGHLFNLYRWGGYLLWRIGPERKVFVDGRSFDSGIVRDALTAELVSFKDSDAALWKRIFEKHHIDAAILPKFEAGAPYALTMALYRDPDWKLVYQSGNGTLFLKREAAGD